MGCLAIKRCDTFAWLSRVKGTLHYWNKIIFYPIRIVKRILKRDSDVIMTIPVSSMEESLQAGQTQTLYTLDLLSCCDI